MHGPRSILSIGHDPTTLTYRHVMLTKAGYSVTSAIKPERALALLSARKFDLIVCCFGGRIETEWLEQFHDERAIPIIFLCCEGSRVQRREHPSLPSHPDTNELLKRVTEIFSELSQRQA